MGLIGVVVGLMLLLMISPFAFITSPGYLNVLAERTSRDAVNRAASALMQYYGASLPSDPYRTNNRFPNALSELVAAGYLRQRELYDGWNRQLVYVVSSFNSSIAAGTRPGANTSIPAAVVISPGRNGVLETNINPSTLNAVTALSLMPQGDDIAAFAIPLSLEIGRRKDTYRKMHRLAQAAINCQLVYGSYPSTLTDLQSRHGLSEASVRDAWGYRFSYTLQGGVPVIALGSS